MGASPHTPIQNIALTMKQPALLLQRTIPYPIDRVAKPVSSARAAGNYFVRKRMLAQAVPTARTTENRFFRRRLLA